MKERLIFKVCKTAGACLAMVLIWLLVQKALSAGIDGVIFFIGVAAIAGLGGYELRWAIEAIKSKNSEKVNEK